MKKTILLSIVLLLILTSCNTNKDEKSSSEAFVDQYNISQEVQHGLDIEKFISYYDLADESIEDQQLMELINEYKANHPNQKT